MGRKSHLKSLKNGLRINNGCILIIRFGRSSGDLIIRKRWAVSWKPSMRLASDQNPDISAQKMARLGQWLPQKGEFPTLKAAANAHGVDTMRLKEWMRLNPLEFYYAKQLSEEELRRLRPGKRAVVTPAGKFETISSAARHYSASPRTMKTWIRSMRSEEFKYT